MTIKEHLEIIHQHVHAIADLLGETVAPITGPEPNLLGLWRAQNQQFVRVSKWDGSIGAWHGDVVAEKDITKSLIFYDKNANVMNREPEWNLVERKRREEKGWPA